MRRARIVLVVAFTCAFAVRLNEDGPGPRRQADIGLPPETALPASVGRRSLPRPAIESPLPSSTVAMPADALPAAVANTATAASTVAETDPADLLATQVVDLTTFAAPLLDMEAQGAGALIPPVMRPDPGFRTAYVAFGVLQGLDAYTTRVALSSGAHELNPVMRGVAARPAALVAVKAGTTVGIIYAVEKLRVRHPVAAAVTMGALDLAYTAIVVNNAQVVRRARATPPP